MVDVYTGDVPNLTQTQPEFDTNTQNILDYIAGIAPQLNEWVGSYVQETTSTSSTEHDISAGLKTFTVEAGKGYKEDMTVRGSAGGGNYVDGNVTAYSGTSLTIDVTNFNGSGTYDDWDIYLTISGLTVLDDPYDESTWNGNNTVPTKNAVRDKIQSVASTFVGSSKNLIVTNNSATPNSLIDVDADEVLLKNSSGVAFLASAVNLTIDIASTGANGLDTGSEAISTNYYINVIYNPTTSTVAGLISASATAPTLPAGYTFSALVGWVYNDASSNLIKVYWIGRKIYVTSALLTTTVPTLSYVSVSTVGILPPQAKITRLNCLTYNATSNATRLFVAPASNDDFAYNSLHQSGSGSATGAQQNIDALTITANTLYYKRTGDALSLFEMRCTGGEW